MSYNRRYNRQGTLWESRFKSVLFEGSRRSLWTLAAYIDLNAVRAGIVSDPQDYRFCGYAEAVAGVKAARDGLVRVMQSPDGKMANWERMGKHYRHLLYQRGAKDPERNRGGIDVTRVEAVLANGGRLTMREALHCRVRYFSDGMILGSRVFVDDTFQRYRSNFGVKRQTGARNMPSGGRCALPESSRSGQFCPQTAQCSRLASAKRMRMNPSTAFCPIS
jgi:putative transposase